MSETTLPAVAKSVHTFCKKCDADRYHVVLAHTSSTAAKVQCEICKSKKTYKVEVPGAPSGRGANLRGAAAKKREAALTAKKSAHENEFRDWMEKNDSQSATKYNMRTKFEVETKVEHPKFGLGWVKTVQPEKIEVVFQDEVRQLVHNRA